MSEGQALPYPSTRTKDSQTDSAKSLLAALASQNQGNALGDHVAAVLGMLPSFTESADAQK